MSVPFSDAVLVLAHAAGSPPATFTIEDIGAGPFIASWSHATLPQPTPEQLAAVTAAQVLAWRLQIQTQRAASSSMLGMSPDDIRFRLILRYFADELNDIRRKVTDEVNALRVAAGVSGTFAGLPPILEPERITQLLTVAQQGYGAPVDPSQLGG